MTKLRNLLRLFVISIRHFIFTNIYKMNIHNTARISFGSKIDKTNPKGIYIGEESYFASGSLMLSHDFVGDVHLNTYVGKRCFIGANAVIMPGIKIGDEVIIGSGAIVTKDIPSNSIAVGNPAKVIKQGIRTKKFGQLV